MRSLREVWDNSSPTNTSTTIVTFTMVNIPIGGIITLFNLCYHWFSVNHRCIMKAREGKDGYQLVEVVLRFNSIRWLSLAFCLHGPIHTSALWRARQLYLSYSNEKKRRKRVEVAQVSPENVALTPSSDREKVTEACYRNCFPSSL